MQSINLSDPFTRLADRWFWPVIATILGGIFGMVFSLAFPPRYEAKAAVAVSVDYGNVDFDELIIEDRLLDRVWQLIQADETLQGAMELLQVEQGDGDAWNSLHEFKQHTRVDSRLSRWEMIGIDRDPKTAKAIANAWYQVALKRLGEAYEHAWNAISLPGAHFDLGCVTLIPEIDVPDFWECIVVAPDLQVDQAANLRAEIEASHGILPVITYEPLGRANMPESPVLWPRGLILLAASSVGLILGTSVAVAVPKEDEAKDPRTESKPQER